MPPSRELFETAQVLYDQLPIEDVDDACAHSAYPVVTVRELRASLTVRSKHVGGRGRQQGDST
jgi:hypothetical protein